LVLVTDRLPTPGWLKLGNYPHFAFIDLKFPAIYHAPLAPLNMQLLTIVSTDVVESSATKRDVSLGRDSRERDNDYLEKVQTRHFEFVGAILPHF
jgi:hypothetical protein